MLEWVLFSGISTFVSYLMLIEEQQWYCLTDIWRGKRVHAFLKSINPKVKVVARLQFELAYYDVAV